MLLRTVFGLGIFMQAGYLFLLILQAKGRTLSFLEQVSLSFGLGVGFVTTQMLLFSFAGVPFTVEGLCAPWGIAWAVYLVVRRVEVRDGLARMRNARVGAVRGMNISFALLVDIATFTFIIAVLGAIYFQTTFHSPLEGNWDAWARWDLKARAFFHDRSVFPFVNDPYYGLTNLEYPVLYPLAGTFLYLTLGEPRFALLIPATFYASLLIILYAVLRRYGAGRTLSLGMTFGLLLMPNVLFWSQQYFAEIPLLYYVFVCAAFLFLFFADPNWTFLAIAGVSAGFATQTRSEGIVIVGFSVLALVAKVVLERSSQAKRRLLVATGLFVSLMAVIFLPWFVFRTFISPYFGLAERLVTGSGNIPARFPILVDGFLERFAQSEFLGLSFLVFFTTLVLGITNLRKLTTWPLIYLLGQTLFAGVPQAAMFLTSLNFGVYDIGRYFLVFTGLCYFLLAVQVVDSFRDWNGDRCKFVLLVFSSCLLAFAVTSFPASVPGLIVPKVSWDFSAGQQGWRPGNNTQLTWDNGLLVVRPASALDPYFFSPENTDFDAATNYNIVIRAKAESTSDRHGPTRFTFHWKPKGKIYGEEYARVFDFKVDGNFHTFILTPGWDGIIEEFRIGMPWSIASDPNAQLIIASIETEPRIISWFRLAVLEQHKNVFPFLFLSIFLLAAGGRLVEPMFARRALLLAIMFAIIVMDLVADIWPGDLLGMPYYYARPASTMREISLSSEKLIGLSDRQKLLFQEAFSGRPFVGHLIQTVLDNVPESKHVALCVSPGLPYGDSGLDGYLMQRSHYLLYPRKVVFFTTDPHELKPELLLQNNIDAVILYNVGLEELSSDMWPAPQQILYQSENRYFVFRVRDR